MSWKLAAPSFVLSGTVAENCRFLAHRVDSVGLCLFETRACLEYGEDDLPPWLTKLRGRDGAMRYHAHLPLDLPWELGADAAADLAVALARHIAWLHPEAYVLHPPATAPELREFLLRWQDAGLDTASLCLENIQGNDLAQTLPLTYEFNCGYCLDFGHILAFGQGHLLGDTRFLERARMLHVYAPGAPGPTGSFGGHKHAPLTRLDREGGETLAAFMAALSLHAQGGGLLVLEIFSWPGIEESLETVSPWLATAAGVEDNFS